VNDSQGILLSFGVRRCSGLPEKVKDRRLEKSILLYTRDRETSPNSKKTRIAYRRETENEPGIALPKTRSRQSSASSGGGKAGGELTAEETKASFRGGTGLPLKKPYQKGHDAPCAEKRGIGTVKVDSTERKKKSAFSPEIPGDA